MIPLYLLTGILAAAEAPAVSQPQGGGGGSAAQAESNWWRSPPKKRRKTSAAPQEAEDHTGALIEAPLSIPDVDPAQRQLETLRAMAAETAASTALAQASKAKADRERLMAIEADDELIFASIL